MQSVASRVSFLTMFLICHHILWSYGIVIQINSVFWSKIGSLLETEQLDGTLFQRVWIPTKKLLLQKILL